MGRRKKVNPARWIDRRMEYFDDCFGAIKCLIDTVGETEDHVLYSAFTGEMLTGETFIGHLREGYEPSEIVSEVCKWHYGLSH